MTRHPARADVVIIGAGPAGAWAAYRLADDGARVAVVDASHPREKPCGGGVTSRALDRVARAVDPASLPAVVVRQARFTDSACGDAVVVPLDRGAPSAEPPLIVASREAFDGRLIRAAEQAGATWHRARALDIVRDGAGFQVRTSDGRLAADFVIGADGANSLVRRRLAEPLARDQISIATGYFAHGATSDGIDLEFTADPPGYIWSFPRPTHLAVGICAQADAGVAVARLRARVAAWLQTSGLAGGAPLRPYAWPIPSLTPRGLRANRVAGPGWCLIGDAAGLVDPITREGIYFALESARLAAGALGGRRAATVGAYADAVADTIEPELARAARLKAGFFRPSFTSLLLEGLRRSPAIRAVMADLVAGRQSYRGLGWRLAATLEVGLALKALKAITRS